jgi:hypothetical protein
LRKISTGDAGGGGTTAAAAAAAAAGATEAAAVDMANELRARVDVRSSDLRTKGNEVDEDLKARQLARLEVLLSGLNEDALFTRDRSINKRYTSMRPVKEVHRHVRGYHEGTEGLYRATIHNRGTPHLQSMVCWCAIPYGDPGPDLRMWTKRRGQR